MDIKSQRKQVFLMGQAAAYADKPAELWPGGESQDSPDAVKPVAEALVVMNHQENEIACGKLDEVQLLLQNGEIAALKTHIRVVAYINSLAAVVTATSDEGQMSRQVSQEAAHQVYNHYLEKYGGQSIYVLTKKEMDDTRARILLEDTRPDSS